MEVRWQQKEMRVGSMFSGLGGLDIAVEHHWRATTAWQLDLTGHDVRARHWPDACQIVGDVRDVHPSTLEPVDILCGGFPCQDLSCAGSRAGLDGARSGLYSEVLRFVAALTPRIVVIENVPGLLRYRDRLTEDFARLGYGLTWIKAQAAHAGAPHLRRRVFVVAERGRPGRGVLETQPGQAAAGRRWATITASEDKGRRTSRARRHDPDMLSEQVRPWPTATASNPNEGNDPTLAARSAALVAKGSRPISEPLGMAVRTWATPISNNGGSGLRGGERRREDGMLVGQVRPWPTATGQLPGKRLNPDWVETLMGLPIGWTLTDGPDLSDDARALVDAPRWPRGRYPADWDRTQSWPGFHWEPSRTIPDDAPRQVGRPARLRLTGNAVCPQQAALALSLFGSTPSLWSDPNAFEVEPKKPDGGE